MSAPDPADMPMRVLGGKPRGRSEWAGTSSNRQAQRQVTRPSTTKRPKQR